MKTYVLVAILLIFPNITFAQQIIKAPRMSMNGIWDIEDDNNKKYDALSLAVSHQFSGIGLRSTEEPIVGSGVVKWPGKTYWSNTQAKLRRAEDGTVTMAFGQFGYCNCVSVEYTMKPSDNPDVLVGEWFYRKGKTKKEKHGKSVWRRRPPVKIDSIYYYIGSANPKQTFTRNKIQYGEGPLKIEQRFTPGTLWITIMGERLAGGHNFWMDTEDNNLNVRDKGWFCKNGRHFDYGDEWRRCGTEKTLGDGVVGLRFAVRVKKKMAPGPRTIWLDGQPIEIYISNENKERGEYTVKTKGDFSLESGEKGKSHANIKAELGNGFNANVAYMSDSMMASIRADSEMGATFQEVAAYNSTDKIGYDLRLPGPTDRAVEKFLEIKALQNTAAMAGDPPGEGKNLAWQPVIFCAKAHDPHSGKNLFLGGLFGLKGKLSVYFQKMHQEPLSDNYLENLFTQTPPLAKWVIDKKIPAKILGRQGNGKGITVQIPDIQGRVYIVVEIGTMESSAYEYKILRQDRKASLKRRVEESMFCQMMDQLLRSDSLGEIARAFHVFTRKGGQFRYRIGSKATEIKIDGERIPMRWIFHLDGRFYNGYKEAFFKLGVSLVPKGQEEAFLTDPNHPFSNPVDLISIFPTKDIKTGKQVYIGKIIDTEFSSLLGVRWDKKDRKLTISEFAGIEAKELGLEMGWDNKNKQVFFKSKNKLGELEITGNDEGGSAKFTETEDRVYKGNLHRFSLSAKNENDKSFTTIKNDVYAGKADSSEKILELELGYDSTVLAGEPNPNVDAKITLFDYIKDKEDRLIFNKSISFKGSMRDYNLYKLDIDFTAIKDQDNFTMGFGYLDEIQGSSIPDQNRWETRLGMQNRFADGDLKIRSLATMKLDTRNHIVDAMTIRLAARAKYDKWLKWGLQVDGAYTRRRRPTRSESWELNVIGSAEIAKVEAFVGLEYRDGPNEKNTAGVWGIKVGGPGGKTLKLFDLKKYRENVWKFYDN